MSEKTTKLWVNFLLWGFGAVLIAYFSNWQTLFGVALLIATITESNKNR